MPGRQGIGLRPSWRWTTICVVEPVKVTARLTLRQFTPADADDLLALDGDPRVMRFLDPTIKSRAQIQFQVLPRLLAYYRRYRGFGFWAAHTRNGGFIGWFGLRPVTPTAAAMVDWPDAPPGDVAVACLGYRLRVSAWGRGYATEGAQALIRRAFSELGVSQVVATTMAVNSASRRVLEKAGLRHVRTVYLDWPDPLPGNEHGDVEYRLDRNDWAAR
jgi:RimJ/RimL family protein N-acetyltransferase